MSIDIAALTDLRRDLHQYPELSNFEEKTSNRIISFIEKTEPDEIIQGVGGHGLAIVYKGQYPGPVVLFRAELDALPIIEKKSFDYGSEHEGVMHACGHDGHMAILAGLAKHISDNRPDKGQVVLLFQPAEETGEGARNVLDDPAFNKVVPDFVFALHNLPGYEKGLVLIREGAFAAASKGMIINLSGKTSHAGEPENGRSPAGAISNIIRKINGITNETDEFDEYVLATIVYIKLGEIAFGTSPGDAVIMATLRAYSDKDMKNLTEGIEIYIDKIAKNDGLKASFTYTEEFPATINDSGCVEIVRNIANDLGFKTQYMKQPFRWSEDFGHFTNAYTGVLFGLGSGMMVPQLHNPDYDFPDELLEPGIKIFGSIYSFLLKF